MIENYLNSITIEKNEGNSLEISPFVKSLSSRINIPNDLDYKKEYSDFLSEKYQ